MHSPSNNRAPSRGRERAARLAVAVMVALSACTARPFVAADEPGASYIFPAGGRRGEQVAFHVGGLNLHGRCGFALDAPDVQAPAELMRGARRLWFEGPVIPLPDSQQKEDYPWPQEGSLTLSNKTPPGIYTWRVWTSQGVTPSLRFVVGELPEVVEMEADGEPIPVEVKSPVTINGRIFPREDEDRWRFAARAGVTYTCEVMTRRLGAPFDARLEVRDAVGDVVESTRSAAGVDSRLSFTPPNDGVYEVRVRDAEHGGLQHYVYRLTISDSPTVESCYPLGGNPGAKLSLQIAGAGLAEGVAEVTLPKEGAFAKLSIPQPGRAAAAVILRLGELPELLEHEQESTSDSSVAGSPSAPEVANRFAPPVTLNGRVSTPGQRDRWKFFGVAGQRLLFDVEAAALGSPLDSRLAIQDASGKQLAENDDAGAGQSDSRLAFTVPATGEYVLEVADAFPDRGGPAFGYRVAARSAAIDEADFTVRLPAAALNVARGASAKLQIACERLTPFDGPIELVVEGLPAGITVSGTTIAPKQNAAQLVFTAATDAVLGPAALRIVGEVRGERSVSRRVAAVAAAVGEPVLDRLWLGVAMPTPFKLVGAFESKFAPRGSTYLREYHVERNGYDGPLTIRLAERQVRHLQGVTGPEIVIPPGEARFVFPIQLAPWMEVGRTSRTCLMAIGEVVDEQGRPHTVSYTSHEQNDQVIVLVDPEQLELRLERRSIRCIPGEVVRLGVHVGRGVGRVGPVSVDVVVPEHILGVEATPLRLGEQESDGVIEIRFEKGEPLGPFNMPLRLRASLVQDEITTTAESSLEVVRE